MGEVVGTDTLEDVGPQTASENGIPEKIHVDLVLDDPEIVAEVCHYPEGEVRNEFAHHAIRIGILALKHARGQIDADAVRREADRMMSRLSTELDQHNTSLNERVTGVLKQYFDPESGHLHERLQRLVKRDGELADMLGRHIGNEDSILCRRLSDHFGEGSQLLKWLNPDKSQGFLAEMNGTLEEQLKGQREAVLNQFSLDNKQSALCRFIDELTRQHGELTKGMEEKIEVVVKEFSLDEENSALSRLVKNVETAEKKIRDEFSLDEENSALARLKRELMNVLEGQARKNNSFQEEVKRALSEMTVRKQEAAKSPQHGLDFEDALSEWIVQQAGKLNDVAERTGSTTGSIRNCKVGDVVIELGPDHSAAGARIAVEAKEDAGYTLKKAREEIETARKNRGAQIGLFVFSKLTAPAELESLVRYGEDVFVVWDPEELESDIYLTAGLTLCRALCLRQAASGAACDADFAAIERAIQEIEKQIGKLDEVSTWAETIKNNSQKILDRVRISKASTQRQIDTLNEKLDDLKQVIAVESGGE